jgi:hypothetical protein
MSQPSTMSARLLAHARLCRDIANATLNEETASKLERMAQDCVQAAREAELAAAGQIVPSSAGSHRATS